MLDGGKEKWLIIYFGNGKSGIGDIVLGFGWLVSFG